MMHFGFQKWLAAICAAALVSGSGWAAADEPIPHWIWASAQAESGQTAYLRRLVEVSGQVKSASLTAAADNELSVSINGREALTWNDWNRPAVRDVADMLRPGANLIAVEAKNQDGPAGLVARLVIKTEDGQQQIVVTDGQWRASAQAERGWRRPAYDDSDWSAAAVLGPLGTAPWSAVTNALFVAAKAPAAPQATPADLIKLPEGFQAERLYSVPADTQGSWVSLTIDAKGRFITSDQYGKLYRVTVAPPDAGSAEPQIETINVDIGTAHGLLYAFDSLYVVAGERDQGLYRVRDTDGDDQFDEAKLLRSLPGGGEHGPHSVILSPDGKSIYLCAGNHTDLPEMERSLVPRHWQEDQLLPRMWDAGGHAVGRMAPGGWIARTDSEGTEFELFSVGYRNEFDIAFNADGELFTYDSDMEWDIGTPWYRPTRVCQATAGSEFGWRSGTGKWPEYYPDSLPATLNIGPGSPTGIVFGAGAKFPAKYQRALFIADWSYGKLYAVHLQPHGASYEGEFELFATASPLPITDVVIHPQDGAMYFTTGGRRTQSGFYRVTYVGTESTASVDLRNEAGEEARQLRRSLEALYTQEGPEVIAKAWPYLSHEDRFIRYAARIAVEHQPVDLWRERALTEQSPDGLLSAVIALARCGKPEDRAGLIEALGRLEWGKLDRSQKLAWLRAAGLAFARLGQPSDAERQQVLAKVNEQYPAGDQYLDQELARLLVYLRAPGVVDRTLKLMTGGTTQEEQMHYALCLRNLEEGWTLPQRREYFEWFQRAAALRGGHSFQGFLANIRNEAIATLSDKDKEALAAVLEAPVAPLPPESTAPPRDIVQQWKVEDLLPAVNDGLHGRNFERGKALFAEATCFKCHRFDGQGGIIGPDLTGVGKRFDYRYLLESIIEPNKVVSDQYQATVFVLSSGNTVIGKVANLANDNIMVITNMLEPGNMTAVKQGDIEEQHPSPVSMMPASMLDTFNEDEILDLLAYLRSGGDPQFEAYQPAAH